VEDELLTEQNSGQIWYPKVLQAVSEAYFDIGNYKKTVQLINRIREIIPFYVIPHNIVMFYYYSGNIEATRSMAQEALDFAERNEITKDVSYLYTALANTELYNGNIEEALRLFDNAVQLDKTNSLTKFFNIALRSMAYARYGDINYAKEITHIYLKYCETYYPQYANMLLCAMAFCYYKLKSPEQAYFYATQCIKTSKARSIFWLIGMAIATTHLLNTDELKDAQKLIRNIIKSSYIYGMEIVLVDNIDIFEPLFDFAIKNNIETDYLNNIYLAVSKKKAQKKRTGNLKIKLFGTTSVLYKEEEIAWKTRKAKELFFHYILAGEKGIDRNVIINYLWKDYLYESAINNLKTTNNIIRKTLSQYNVDFKLEYMNTKYILTLKDVSIDYLDYARIASQYKREINIKKQIELMNIMLDIYKEDFALDMDKADFNNARQSIKQELMIKLLKLSRELSQAGDYIEAKKFIQALAIIDRNTDYTQKIAEIDSYITL
jgi:two-component SAPR family response regulator